jgi:hypothetical protein
MSPGSTSSTYISVLGWWASAVEHLPSYKALGCILMFQVHYCLNKLGIWTTLQMTGDLAITLKFRILPGGEGWEGANAVCGIVCR